MSKRISTGNFHFSPRQQMVLAICGVCYALGLLGTGWQNAHQSRVDVLLADPVPETVKYFIDPPIDLNTAGYEELQLLPSIGPVLARRILHYRQQYGPFRTIAELENIHGIGPKTVQKLTQYLEFADTASTLEE